MKNWGYAIKKDTQIDLDTTDKSFREKLINLEPSFAICMFCGTCTATCSAAQFTDFNIMKLNLMIRRGLIDDVEQEIKKCMLCGKCRLACPRGVNTRNMILSIQRIVAERKS